MKKVRRNLNAKLIFNYCSDRLVCFTKEQLKWVIILQCLILLFIMRMALEVNILLNTLLLNRCWATLIEEHWFQLYFCMATENYCDIHTGTKLMGDMGLSYLPQP